MTHESLGRRGFGAAEAYDAGRPGYAPQTIDRLVDELALDTSSRVLDLAAGTGQITRALAPRVGAIAAVEPSAPMREVLVRRVPAATVLEGEAASIPVPTGSMDAVVVGEAFHWFATPEVLAEIGRVLRRRGGLALLWNVATATQPPWPSELDRLVRRRREDAVSADQRYDSGHWRTAFSGTAEFTDLRSATGSHEQHLDPEGIAAQVASWSYIATLPDAERDDVLEMVRSWAPSRLTVRFRTDLYWCQKR